MTENEFKFLIELLEDEDVRCASMAMAALLDEDEKLLEQRIRSLQKSDNPRLRMRIGQMESARLARKKRRNTARRLSRTGSDAPSLLEQCIQLHLLWFDCDMEKNVGRLYAALLTDARKKLPEKPQMQDCAAFMRNRGFEACMNDDMNALFYCIGAVMENQCGADIVLCVIAQALMWEFGVQTDIFRHEDDFGLVNNAGDRLFPAVGWTCIPYAEYLKISGKTSPCLVCNSRQVVRYILAALYQCAVGSDSFRYIYTIGKNMADMADVPDIQENLPYPYRTKA